MNSEFELDPIKAASNLQKHAVSFTEAATVFFDPLSLTVPDPMHSLAANTVSSLLDYLISNVISSWCIRIVVIE